MSGSDDPPTADFGAARAAEGVAAASRPPLLKKGLDLLETGSAAQAVTALAKAAHFHPQIAEAHAALASAHHAARQFQEARRAALAALQLEPDFAFAHYILGKSLIALDDPDAALVSLEKALRLKPRDPKIWRALASAYRDAGYGAEALSLYRALLRVRSDDLDATVEAGRCLLDEGDVDAARRILDGARRKDADGRLTGFACDVALAEGDFDRAAGVIRGLRETHPNRAAALLYAFARAANGDVLRTHGALFDGLVDRLRGNAAGPLIVAHYAVAERDHACGDVDRAFRHFSEGARVKKASLPYDSKETTRRLHRGLSAYDQGPHAIATPPIHEKTAQPIFITGMSRSGTTLVEQILACHRDVSAAGELGFLGHAFAEHRVFDHPGDAARLMASGVHYLEKLRRFVRGRAFVTDKMPFNFTYLGQIATALPEAQIILLRRDPLDVAWGNFRVLFGRPLAWSYDFERLAAFLGAFDAVAAGWLDRLGDRVRVVDYETLVSAPDEEIPRLLDDLGLPWDPACLRPEERKASAKTASRYQVRRPISAAAIGGARRYGERLAPLQDALSAHDFRFLRPPVMI